MVKARDMEALQPMDRAARDGKQTSPRGQSDRLVRQTKDGYRMRDMPKNKDGSPVYGREGRE